MPILFSSSVTLPCVAAFRVTPSASIRTDVQTVETEPGPLWDRARLWTQGKNCVLESLVVFVGEIDIIHTFPHRVHRICWLASLSMGHSNLRATPQIQRPNRIGIHRRVKVLRHLDLPVWASYVYPSLSAYNAAYGGVRNSKLFTITSTSPSLDGDGQSRRP